MGVTPDELELPIVVTDTVNELSKITGVNRGTISSCISRGLEGSKTGIKFVRVEFYEDDI